MQYFGVICAKKHQNVAFQKFISTQLCSQRSYDDVRYSVLKPRDERFAMLIRYKFLGAIEWFKFVIWVPCGNRVKKWHSYFKTIYWDFGYHDGTQNFYFWKIQYLSFQTPYRTCLNDSWIKSYHRKQKGSKIMDTVVTFCWPYL